jgi:hypothetical protein
MIRTTEYSNPLDVTVRWNACIARKSTKNYGMVLGTSNVSDWGIIYGELSRESMV